MNKAPTGNVMNDFHAGKYCDSATKWPQHVAVGETHCRAWFSWFFYTIIGHRIPVNAPGPRRLAA